MVPRGRPGNSGLVLRGRRKKEVGEREVREEGRGRAGSLVSEVLS